MKKDKSTLSNLSQKEPVPSNGSGSGLAMGLYAGPAIGALKKNKKAEEQEDDDEKQ